MTARRLAAVPAGQPRDGAYVRVSAIMGREGEDFLSPTVQIDAIKGASERDGGRLVEVWEDLDVSGRSMARAGLDQALAAAREGRIDRLYVYDLSRWARNAAEGLTELAAIEKTGVEVVSATERLDRTTSSGRLTAGLLLLLAEHYSDLVGDRWRGVLQANAERGVLHGKAPIGYVRAARREVVEDPTLGPAMRDAFVRYAETGVSLKTLARDLARVRGVAFTAANLKTALRSEVYLGRTRLNGQSFEGRHPALVDPETWQAVQRRLDQNARTPSRTLDVRHPLAGIVRCDGCGWTAWRRLRNDRPHLGPFYCCRGRKDDGTSTCPGFGTPRVADVEAEVLRLVADRYAGDADTSAAEAARLARQARAHADASQVQSEIAKTEKALGVLAAKLGTGVLTDTAYRAGTAALEEALVGLRGQLAAALEVADAPAFEAARSLAAALLDLWEPMTVEERAQALRAVVREVRIRPGRRGAPAAGRVDVVFR